MVHLSDKIAKKTFVYQKEIEKIDFLVKKNEKSFK